MSTYEDSKKSAQSEDVNSNTSVGDLQIIRMTYQLDGKNYLKWSMFVQTYLKGKGRTNHILGKGPKPGEKRFWGVGCSRFDGYVMAVGINRSNNKWHRHVPNLC